MCVHVCVSFIHFHFIPGSRSDTRANCSGSDDDDGNGSDINLLGIDPNSATDGGGTASSAGAAALAFRHMSDFIENLPPNRMVVIAVGGDGSNCPATAIRKIGGGGVGGGFRRWVKSSKGAR